MSLFIVGMHRSGTSLLTGLLAMCGADVGPRQGLTGSNRHNPKGFWEQNRFRQINESLLAHQGREWDCPLGFDVGTPGPDESVLRQRARSILESLHNAPVFVVKDPRLCLTFAFWRGICPQALPILPIRNPVEVSFSLYRRNNLPIPIGVALWELYVLSAARQASSSKPIAILHADLVVDPVGQMEQLVGAVRDRLGPVMQLPSSVEIETFFDASLYRERRDDADDRAYLVADQLVVWEAARNLDIRALAKMPLSPASVSAMEGYEALGMQFSRVRAMERSLHGNK